MRGRPGRKCAGLLCSQSVQPNAGVLRHSAFRSEPVAIKVISTLGASQAQRAAAKNELSLMAMLTEKLRGRVVALEGWCETGGNLLVAMELADGSLRSTLDKLPSQRMPLSQWVRCVIFQPQECPVND